MFYQATTFNQPLNFNTSKVASIEYVPRGRACGVPRALRALSCNPNTSSVVIHNAAPPIFTGHNTHLHATCTLTPPLLLLGV